MPTAVRIFEYTWRYWKTLTIAFICLVFFTVIDLYVPELVRQVIDCSIKGSAGVASGRTSCPLHVNPTELAAHPAVLIIVLPVRKGIFQFGQGYLGEFGAQGTAYDLRNEMYAHFQRLSFSWHDR